MFGRVIEHLVRQLDVFASLLATRSIFGPRLIVLRAELLQQRD